MHNIKFTRYFLLSGGQKLSINNFIKVTGPRIGHKFKEKVKKLSCLIKNMARGQKYTINYLDL